MLPKQLSPNHSINMVEHADLGAWQGVIQSLCLSLQDRMESSFPCFGPSNDIVDPKSVLGIKLGGSGVVIWYQVDEFTHTWLQEYFVASLQINLSFTDKMIHLTHLPFESGCEDYVFWAMLVMNLSKVLILSSQIPSKPQTWNHPLMNVMPLHLESFLFPTQYLFW